MKLTKLKKHLAMLLSAAMVFTCLPATAMAAQADDDLVEEGTFVEDVLDAEASEIAAAEEDVTASENASVSNGAIPTSWNFRSGSDIMGTTAGVKIEKNSASANGLYIDATTGKFDTTRSDWAQVNTGTKIYIPVAGPSEITIGFYSEGVDKAVALSTVDGKKGVVDGKTAVFETLGTASANGIEKAAVFEMGGNDYIGTISVAGKVIYPTEWNFRSGSDIMGTTAGVKIEKATGTAHYLYIDATTGKFDSTRTDWAQVNTGTKIYIPVSGASKITVGFYSEGSDKAVALSKVDGVAGIVNGKTAVFTTKGKEKAGDLEKAALFEMGGNDYIGSIKVESIPEEEEIDPATCVAEGEYKYVGIKSTEEFEALEHTGIKLNNFSWHGETYGLTDNNKGGSIELTLASDAIVTVEQGYGTGVELKATSGVVNVVNNTGIYTKGEGQIFTVAGLKKGKQVLSFAKATGYLSCLKVFYINSGKVYNHDEIDLYDFSGDAVKTDAQGGSYYTKAVKTINGSDKINYRITNKEINSWYGTGAEVKDGVNFPAAFTMKDVSGNKLLAYDGVGKTNNRLRTLNDKVVRYDTRGLNMNKELPEYVAYDEGTDNKDTANSAYPGYFYSNNGSNPNVYVAVATDEGDKVTAVLASNGTDSEIHFENMVDKEDGQVFNYTGAGYGEPHEFYAAADSLYKFYSTNEKLCVARIIVEHAQYATVTGNVDTSATTGLPSDYKIRFTNKLSGEKKDVSVESGKYTVELPSGFGYEYELSLIDANGFVIKSERTLDLKEKKASASLDVKIENVPLAKITGKITGLNEVSLKRVQLSTETKADVVYVPEFKIDRTTGEFTAQYEVGVEYTLIAKDVEDYTLAKSTIKYDADKVEDIVFNAKPTYKVTVKSNIDTKELVSANFIFTLLEGEEFTPSTLYTYEFKGVDDIKLRDGQYKVVVRNSGKYVQKLTADVKVAGKAADAEINFTDDVRLWDFASADYTSRATEYKNNLTAGVESNYNGLSFKGGQVNKTYLLQGDGYVKVPVKGNATIKASACYQYDFYFKDETEPSVGQKTGSTSQIDTFTYDYTGEAGYVTITTKSTTYFTSIEVVYPVAYKAEVTVGADAEYKTINEALDAVKSMDRKDGENTKPVTVKIQPGDYQEMLVIDVPNIKFVNAAEKPDTVLKNKGVEIGENAVRITGYYGHGYTYYSMDSNCKYDAELLEINKKNGYPSFINPGSGTTNNSYWNATVSVKADDISFENIILENSFNQYQSELAAKDIIVKQSSAKEGDVTRADIKALDPKVQEKSYVERAAALAIYNNVKRNYYEGCRIIGHQDTLYGGTGVTAGFYNCDVYGGTDYIFGGMTAVFAKCNLVANTVNVDAKGNAKNDTFYITAPQQSNGRGYLMYNCNVISTTPGVDTIATKTSKQGYFGRPWQANTSEAVFYATNVGTTNIPVGTAEEFPETLSLIRDEGWLNSLGGSSNYMYEFGTYEAAGVDNSKKRAEWVNAYAPLDKAVIAGVSENKLNKDIKVELTEKNAVSTFLGEWDAFKGKDMAIVQKLERNTTFEPLQEEGGEETVSGNGATEEESAKSAEAAAEKIGDKNQSGTVDNVIQAAGDTATTALDIQSGKVKAVTVSGIKEGSKDNKITMNTKVKLGGLSGYTTVSTNSTDPKIVKFAAKAQKAASKKGIVTLKAFKQAPVYSLYFSNEKTQVEVVVVNVALDKSIKKSVALTPGTAVSANDLLAKKPVLSKTEFQKVDANIATIGTTPADKRFGAGVWIVGKTSISKVGQVVENIPCGKLTVNAVVNVDGTISVAPANGEKGAVKLAYNLNGKVYKTAIKVK